MPTVPPGNDVVVISGGLCAAAIVIVNCLVVISTFCAPTLKVKVPAVVGVPEITPVLAFKLNPAGRDPDEILHVIGVVPVATMV